MKSLSFILILCLLVVSCKKEENEISPLRIIDLRKDVRINDVQFRENNIWWACGGRRDEEGYIFRSRQGTEWDTYKVEFPRSVYCLEFLDDLNGFAGGDYLHLWRTTDGGATWSFYWLGDQVPFNEEDRPAVRDIEMISGSSWYFCGGENLGEGVFYQTKNAGVDWQFNFQQHEYRTISFLDSTHALIAGHGSVLTMVNDISQLEQTDFANDFMTSSVVLNEASCIAVSYNGAIYRTDDKGSNWSGLVDHDKLFHQRVNWNDIARNGNYVVSVGNDGWLGESKDNGASWTFSRVRNKPHLYCVTIYAGRVFAGSDSGQILQLK